MLPGQLVKALSWARVSSAGSSPPGAESEGCPSSRCCGKGHALGFIWKGAGRTLAGRCVTLGALQAQVDMHSVADRSRLLDLSRGGAFVGRPSIGDVRPVRLAVFWTSMLVRPWPIMNRPQRRLHDYIQGATQRPRNYSWVEPMPARNFCPIRGPVFF
jgi:hypothetical protein